MLSRRANCGEMSDFDELAAQAARPGLASARSSARGCPLFRAVAIFVSGCLCAGLACAQPRPQLGPPPVPAENPLTPAKIELGRALFWDEQLSSTGNVACGTCHVPAHGGSDPRSARDDFRANPGPDFVSGTLDDIRGSSGVPVNFPNGTIASDPVFGFDGQVGSRRTPSMIGAAFFDLLFWDGRARSRFVDPETGETLIATGGALENQALGPLVNPVEMAHIGGTLADVVARIERVQPLALATNVPASLATFVGDREYPALFADAFGSRAVTAARIAMAIASYERSIAQTSVPFDEFLAGNDNALTPLEREGHAVFRASRCDTCHLGPLLTDGNFQYIGVRPVEDDLGRFQETGVPADRGAFRTPGLRNVALRAPYMHDGRFTTLEDVVEFYDRGGDFNAPNKPPQVTRLFLTTEQKRALAAFLRRPLTDPAVASEAAPFDHPVLNSETDRLVAIADERAGDLSIAVPSPPLAGGRLVVGVRGATPGSTARLVVAGTDPGRGAKIAAGSIADVPFVVGADGTGSVATRFPAEAGATVRLRVYAAGKVTPLGWANTFARDWGYAPVRQARPICRGGNACLDGR